MGDGKSKAARLKESPFGLAHNRPDFRSISRIYRHFRTSKTAIWHSDSLISGMTRRQRQGEFRLSQDPHHGSVLTKDQQGELQNRREEESEITEPISG